MQTRKLFLMASCLTVLGLLLASCAPAAAPTPTPKAPLAETPAAKPAIPTPTPKPAAVQPKYGGILTTALGAEGPSFDVHQEGSYTICHPLSAAYNMLLRNDPFEVTKLIPDLATSWEISSDGLVYTFHLAKGVKWHDGAPFTAEDVKFSLDRIRKPPKGVVSPRQEYLRRIDNVRAPDENTVIVELKETSALLLDILSINLMPILPKHIIEAKGDMKRDVCGTGPFRFVNYTRGTLWEFARNNNYFKQGLPYLDGVNYYVIQDKSTLFAAFRTRRLLMTGIHRQLYPEQRDILVKAHPEVVVQQECINTAYMVRMNTKRAPLGDVRVRHAISLAHDRAAMIRIVSQGAGKIGGIFQPTGRWNLPMEELVTFPGYGPDAAANLQEAKRLLAEAGYAGGFETEILFQREMASAIEYIVAVLKTVGIKVKPVVIEKVLLYERQRRGDYEMWLERSGAAFDDPELYLGYLYVSGAPMNAGQYSNPRVEEIYLNLGRILDPLERKKVANEIERLVLRDCPNLVLFWNMYLMAHWPEVRGYKMAPSNFQNASPEFIWLAR